MKKEAFNSAKVVSYKQFQVNHAVKVGNTIYVSGQVAWDKDGNVIGEGNLEAQSVQALENLKSILAEAGATLNDVVKLNVFWAESVDWEKTIEVWKGYFTTEPFPAVTATIAKLAYPELLVEFDAIAVVSD